ncbi:IS3 family transposase [Cytobacillus praedii]|uniref:IS3 family transposase n=1 Tax=Cytobacillus praedii TaxID=1742358 RepID=UPI003F7DA0CB
MDQEIIEHINEEKAHYPVKTMGRVLKLPKSTYYQAAHKMPSAYQIENEEITKRIREIHKASKGRYGAPKIHYLLRKEGFQVSIKRVQRLMKQAGVRSIIVKKYRPASFQGHIEERENRLEQDFQTTSINEKWATFAAFF